MDEPMDFDPSLNKLSIESSLAHYVSGPILIIRSNCLDLLFSPQIY